MSKTPASPRPGEPITLVRTARGGVRYRTVLDYAQPGEPRQQRRATFNSLTEARAHVASVRAKRDAGALPTRDRDTFNRFADEYIADRRAHVRPITLGTYISSLKPARAAFGEKPIGKVTLADIEALSRALGSRGTTARTTKMTLGRVQAVLERALRQGAVVRNVAHGVAALGAQSRKRQAMTLEEYNSVAHQARAHRLAVAWSLCLHGLRRSEVLALRWQDISLGGSTPSLSVSHGRTGDGSALTAPKTLRGRRELPLTDELVGELRQWRGELSESLGLATVHADAFIVVDEAGRPVRPEWFSDEWVRLCRAAGVSRRVLLHEARHTSVTLMRAAGVPDRIVAAWHGHDESIMRQTYDHAGQDSDALAEAARVLAAVRSASA